MPSGMLMVSAIFLTWEDLGFGMCHEAKCLCKTLVMNSMWIFFNLNEVLSRF
jgi:hypothetical protein